MKKKLVLAVIIFFLLTFFVYKVVVQPLRQNQTEINKIATIIEDSLDGDKTYIDIEVIYDDSSIQKVAQKYSDGDYYIIETYSGEQEASTEVICSDNNLYIWNSYYPVYENRDEECRQDYFSQIVDLSSLKFEDLNDDKLSFIYSDDYTKIVFDEDVIESVPALIEADNTFTFSESEIVSLIIYVYDDDRMKIVAGLENDGIEFETVLLIDNSVVIELPDYEADAS